MIYIYNLENTNRSQEKQLYLMKTNTLISGKQLYALFENCIICTHQSQNVEIVKEQVIYYINKKYESHVFLIIYA